MGLFHQFMNGEAVFRGKLLEQHLNPLLNDRLDGIPVAVILDDDLVDDFVVKRQGFPRGIIKTARRGQIDRGDYKILLQRQRFDRPQNKTFPRPEIAYPKPQITIAVFQVL